MELGTEIVGILNPKNFLVSETVVKVLSIEPLSIF